MEGFDNCKLCTFLLKENELLREQLYQLSIKSSQTDPQNISSETQTDFQRDHTMCTSCENYDQTIEMVEKICQTDPSVDSSVDCIDSPTENFSVSDITKDSTPMRANVSEVISLDNTVNLYGPDDPFTVIPDKPFVEFDASKLDEEIDFVKISDREVKYYGEYDYMYGKITHKPCSIPNNGHLASIVNKVKSVYPTQNFNSVLVTKYKDGQSHLPLHSDNETEIVPDTQILTVSLGASRAVKFQSKCGSVLKSLQVSHGDAYLMSVNSQAYYKHGIPKDFGKHMRISLTFRSIRPKCSEPTNGCPSGKTEGDHVDTLFISSSMFRHLKETELRSEKHSSKVLFYPGATAGDIIKRLQVDPEFKKLVPERIKKIYLLCGTNNVDQVLNVPRSLYNSAHIDIRGYNGQVYEKSLVEIEQLVNFLHRWLDYRVPLNILNILPRQSSARNFVINGFNEFLNIICQKQGHSFIGTELHRNLFTDINSFRRNDLFKVNGSDNVHLSNAGVVKLGKFLKYHMHREKQF